MQKRRKARHDRDQNKPKQGELKLSKAKGEHWSDNHTFRRSCHRLIPFRDKLGQNREVSHRIPVACLGLVVDDVSGRVIRKIFFKRWPCARQNPVPSIDTRRQPAENKACERECRDVATGGMSSRIKIDLRRLTPDENPVVRGGMLEQIASRLQWLASARQL